MGVVPHSSNHPPPAAARSACDERGAGALAASRASYTAAANDTTHTTPLATRHTLRTMLTSRFYQTLDVAGQDSNLQLL